MCDRGWHIDLTTACGWCASQELISPDTDVACHAHGTTRQGVAHRFMRPHADQVNTEGVAWAIRIRSSVKDRI
jgi:hypothetical protein